MDTNGYLSLNTWLCVGSLWFGVHPSPGNTPGDPDPDSEIQVGTVVLTIKRGINHRRFDSFDIPT